MAELIVALDFDSREQIQETVRILRPQVAWFKIGLQAYTAFGPELVRELVKQDVRLFLDLKLHDIPTTVAKAAVECTRLGVSMLNVHAGGGAEMMKAAQNAVVKCCLAEDRKRPLLIAVTVLTSMNANVLDSVGVTGTADRQVERLAQLAKSSGMDGVVCSPREAPALGAAHGPGFVLVTPGVRPAGSMAHDQERTLTPGEAVRAGAHFLVVGRPITGAPDPEAAARDILAEMAA